MDLHSQEVLRNLVKRYVAAMIRDAKTEGGLTEENFKVSPGFISPSGWAQFVSWVHIHLTLDSDDFLAQALIKYLRYLLKSDRTFLSPFNHRNYYKLPSGEGYVCLPLLVIACHLYNKLLQWGTLVVPGDLSLNISMQTF